MNRYRHTRVGRHWIRRLAQPLAGVLLGGALASAMAQSTVELADRPLFSTSNVSGNLLLALSVEWPTANTPAYVSTVAYSSTTEYKGYFDPAKCYTYQYNATTPTASYFAPYGAATNRECTSTSSLKLFSGNYMNWAAMQSLDIFRWTLTGGHRSTDTVTDTVIEKTRHSGQGSRNGLYPDKVLSSGVSGATPFAWSGVVSRVHGLGTELYLSDRPQLTCWFNTNSNRRVTFTCASNAGSDFSCNTGNSNPAAGGTASCTSSLASPTRSMSCSVTRSAAGVNSGNTYGYTCDVTMAGSTQTCAAAANYGGGAADASCAPAVTVADYNPAVAPVAGTFYRVQGKVKVCDPSVGAESNCQAYGSNYKPEGLMQRYAMQLRYGAFGYLTDDNVQRDGGVLRARMKHVGPQTPVPGSAAVTNANAEWSASTGQFVSNPDSTDATSTASLAASEGGFTVAVDNSGVVNYLNKFGRGTGNLKSYDPVSEMYYAATRYFKNLGNVPSYTSFTGAGSQANLARWIDGFPVIRNWNDPVQYACQKNFILGIGDVYTHRDRNVPGSTITSGDEPAVPSQVTADTTVNATTANNMVGQLEGLTGLGTYSSGRNNSYYIAGLAYDAHVRDIRSDLSGRQTIDTYWLDVRENQTYESRNQFWLAAKYGGFTIPATFDPYASGNGTTTIPTNAWSESSTDLVGADRRPQNYFIASNADALVNGLTNAFASIAAASNAATSTAFSTTTARLSSTGTATYATVYDPLNWTGNVEGSEITFDADGDPTLSFRWSARTLLDARSASSRRIVTCCTASGAALPFAYSSMSSATLHARTNLASFEAVPNVASGSQSRENFLNYLRGDRSRERTNGGPYRTRQHVLGDIVGSAANPVGPPNSPFLDLYNPGYSAFKGANASRTTVVYVGANDGMMHAFDGSLPSGATPCANCGQELFAYVPSFTYGDASTAADRGLAQLGNPYYQHRFYVDATPQHFDVDFRRTAGSTATSPDWRTVLIGGMGKGGRGYYAIDVTDPTSWTSESAVAGKVLWEFSNDSLPTALQGTLGYGYGEVSVVKTAKYGWTVVIPSGYNNSDGRGYLFLVNPRTGALLEAIRTPEGSTTAPLNLAHATAFVPSFRDYTAESVYAGDLRGNVWRFDLRGSPVSYAEPTKIATLTDSGGVAQPVTTRPLVEIDPSPGNRRFVIVGTGRLLAESDILSSQQQSLYVIRDGTGAEGGFYTEGTGGTLPIGSFPVDRGDLTDNNDPVTGIGTPSATSMGWYIDLEVTSNVAERVDVTPQAYQGSLLVAANLPNGEACNPAGTGRYFGLRMADGQSTLVDPTDSSVTVGSVAVSAVVRNLAYLNVAGTTNIYIGTGRSGSGSGSGSGGSSYVEGSAGNIVKGSSRHNATVQPRRLNWREVAAPN